MDPNQQLLTSLLHDINWGPLDHASCGLVQNTHTHACMHTHTHAHACTHTHIQPLPDQQKASPFPPPPEDPFPAAPVEIELSERKDFNFSDGITAAEIKAKQFRRSDLLLLEKLGEGEYGPIYRCALMSLWLVRL